MKKRFFLTIMTVSVCLGLLVVCAKAAVLLTYQDLGWHEPETSQQAWERSKADSMGFPSIAARSVGPMIIPTRKGNVYIVNEGETMPNSGNEISAKGITFKILDNGSGIGAMEFSSDDESGFIILQFGIVLPVGTQMKLSEDAVWNGTNVPKGLVQVTSEGLNFTGE
jgi:hypothetical protein